MRVLVIKFNRGYRLVRAGRSIEVWKDDERVAKFKTWNAALQYLDSIDPTDTEVFSTAKIQ